MEQKLKETLREWADRYEDRRYFEQDPIVFPQRFLESGHTLSDVEIAGIIAAHLAWGRRTMIVRDCTRAFDEMQWQPYKYVMSKGWERHMDNTASLHRTVRWSEFAEICRNMHDYYSQGGKSLECLDADGIRTVIYGRAHDPNAANKKIHMLRRWFVRRNSPVDMGIWKGTSPESLMLPLDVHSHRQALELGLTSRKSKDFKCVTEITTALREVFPGDPCRGDFALFGYGVSETQRKDN